MKQKMAERAEAVHEQRRRFLVQALSSGALVGGLGWNLPALAGLLGRIPGKMPQGKSVFQLKGEVRVDGKPAGMDTLVTAQSRIETGADSLVIVAVGDGAFIVRERSVLEMSGKQLLIRGLQVLSGALLSVFGHRDENQGVQVGTPVATIGIRGSDWMAALQDNSLYTGVNSGGIAVNNAANSLLVDAGQYSATLGSSATNLIPLSQLPAGIFGSLPTLSLPAVASGAGGVTTGAVGGIAPGTLAIGAGLAAAAAALSSSSDTSGTSGTTGTTGTTGTR